MEFYEVSKALIGINLSFITILILLGFLGYVETSLILSTVLVFVVALIITFVLETSSFVNKIFTNI